MMEVAYGIAFPASRGVLAPPVAPALDAVTGVTITGAWSLNRPLLTGFGSADRFRVRDTVTADATDAVTPAGALSFLSGHAGAIVSLYDHSGNGRTLTNAVVTQQPAFVSGIGALSRAGASFDASDDVLKGAPTLNFMSASSGYVMVVAKTIALTTSDATRFKNQQLWMTVGGWAGATARIGGAIDSCNFSSSAQYAEGASASAEDAMFVHEWWHEGGVLYSRANGGTTYQVASGNTGNMSSSFCLGRGWDGAGAHGTNGAIVETICMTARPAQADAVVADVMAFYGID
jgi:hypothetical protein